MSTAPPRLAPIFRSDTQLQILGATYLEPERHFTNSELVERSRRPQPAVERLVEAGLLETELRSGRRNVWAATTSPIFDELHSILLKTIGPEARPASATLRTARRRARTDLRFLGGRWHGEPGPFLRDVDLMVVGTGDVGEIRAAADEASRTLDRDVNVTVLRATEWGRGKNQFIRHIKSGLLSSWT